MTTDVQVHVIDDDEGVRESLSFLFEMSGVTSTTHADPAAFLELAPGIASGCIVTDVRMPQMNGLELVRKLRERGVNLPVIVITGHGDVPLAVEAMKAGAIDFLEKPFKDEALLDAVRHALEDTPSVDGELQAKIAALSMRERQVLERLVRGAANKVIARDLGISDRTVEIYRAKVMTKMGAESFAELIRMAMLAGISVENG
jgi:two-component system, LuxR family, response regulator FixJ